MARVPELFERDALPEDKRQVHDYLVETRGRVTPGFSTILNNAEVAYRVAQLGSYIRFESSLPDNVRELAALTASAEMDGIYEQRIHTQDCIREGVTQPVIDAVNEKRELTEGTADEALAVRCARELTRGHELADETFAEIRSRFGDSGVVELVATVGYYSMLGFLHNALQAGR